jgi:hypothetical protein
MGGITLTPSELPGVFRLSSIIRDFLLSGQWQPVISPVNRGSTVLVTSLTQACLHAGKVTAQFNLPLNSAVYCYFSQVPLSDHYDHTYEYHFPSDVLQCTAVV